MNIQRFTAATTREALAQARLIFGDDAVILATRATHEGTEVTVTSERELSQMSAPAAQPRTASVPQAAAALAAPSVPASAAQQPLPNESTSVQSDTEQLAMSTLSFQDYVRERMLRRQQQDSQPAGIGQAQTPAATPAQPKASFLSNPFAALQKTSPAPQPTAAALQPAQPSTPQEEAIPQIALRPAAAVLSTEQPASTSYPNPTAVSVLDRVEAPVLQSTFDTSAATAAARLQAVVQQDATPVASMETALPAASSLMPSPTAQPITIAPAEGTLREQQRIAQELRRMKDMINTRLNTLSWFGEARRDPVRQTLMLQLARTGFSPALTRQLLERLPQQLDLVQAAQWLEAVLAHNLRVDAAEQQLLAQGGVFALVGPTGVGKTTTIAKLAGQHANTYGPASVGLISFDTSRPAALEQLRAQVQPFGVIAHEARTAHDLQALLDLFSSRRLVLIDTAGLSPNDPRVAELLAMLDLPFVQRVVVLNANSPQETLDHVLQTFGATAASGNRTQALLTKIDETYKLGPALSALISHKAVLRGVCNGQRVADDFAVPPSQVLVEQALAGGQPRPAAHSSEDAGTELDFFFAMDGQGMQPTALA